MKKLLVKFKSQRGALDKVIVTLLLVIVGVAGIVGLEQWSSQQRNSLQESSKTAVSKVINE